MTVLAQRERRYQLTKVKAGDWLLPSNDREQLWRIYSYREYGDAEILTDAGYVPLRGIFWCAARYARDDWPNRHPDLEVALSDEDLLDWDHWEPRETTLGSRMEAIQAALRGGEEL